MALPGSDFPHGGVVIRALNGSNQSSPAELPQADPGGGSDQRARGGTAGVMFSHYAHEALHAAGAPHAPGGTHVQWRGPAVCGAWAGSEIQRGVACFQARAGVAGVGVGRSDQERLRPAVPGDVKQGSAKIS